MLLRLSIGLIIFVMLICSACTPEIQDTPSLVIETETFTPAVVTDADNLTVTVMPATDTTVPNTATNTATAIPATDTPIPPQATPTRTLTPLPATITPAPAIIGQHRVQANETYFCIGRGYGVDATAIQNANNNRPLTAGMIIDIPRTQWVNIPAGPVCPSQFPPIYPTGVAASVSPATTRSNLGDITTESIVDTPTNTPRPIIELTATPTLESIVDTPTNTPAVFSPVPPTGTP